MIDIKSFFIAFLVFTSGAQILLAQDYFYRPEAENLDLPPPSDQERLSDEGFLQRRETPRSEEAELFRPLNLRSAIEQGVRSNHAQTIRTFRLEQLELEREDIISGFWYPQLRLSLSTLPQRIGTLRYGDLGGQIGTDRPAGAISLGFDHYTLFNWGRDYISYLNQQEMNARERKKLEEERRELIHQVMIAYARLLSSLEIEKFYRDQLRHATYIYNLNRERVSLRRVTHQEYYQSRSEFLRAQTEFFSIREQTQQAHRAMAEILNDPAETRYSLNEKIHFRPVNLRMSEALDLAKKFNPNILQATSDTIVATQNYDLARKNNLPLPTIGLSLGAYQHTFGTTGRDSTRYSTAPGSSDLELVATLNATWPLFGRGGAFNSRELRQNYLEKRIQQQKLEQSRQLSSSSIQQFFYALNLHQNQVEILSARETTAKKTFDTVMQNYIDGRATFLDFREALMDYTQTRGHRQLSLFEHFRNRVELASTIGVNEFPGENFENLIGR